MLGSPAPTSFHPRTQMGFSYHSVLAVVRAWVHLTRFLCLMVTAFLGGRGTRCSDGNPWLIIPPIPVPHSPLALLFDTPSMVLTEYLNMLSLSRHSSLWTASLTTTEIYRALDPREIARGPQKPVASPRSHVSSVQCRILANLWRHPTANLCIHP